MESKIGFYSVKTFWIFLISIYYFIFGSLLSYNLNKYVVFDTENDKNKHFVTLFIEILIIFGIIGVGFYFIRIFVKNIPYPFNGFYDYDHTKLKEASGGVIIAYLIFSYQTKLTSKMTELKSRLL